MYKLFKRKKYNIYSNLYNITKKKYNNKKKQNRKNPNIYLLDSYSLLEKYSNSLCDSPIILLDEKLPQNTTKKNKSTIYHLRYR